MLRNCMQIPLEIKAVDDQGVFEGYGSVFDVLDAYDEIVVRGAFVDSLAEWRAKGRMPGMFWQHNMREPIGLWTEMEEDPKGLHVLGQLALKTVRGAETYELMKMGALDGLSIGYDLLDYEVDTTTNIWRLKKLKLWEVSVVSIPACDPARVVGVKSAVERGDVPSAHDLVAYLVEGGLSRERAQLLVENGYGAIVPPKPEDVAAWKSAAALVEQLRTLCA